MRIVNLTPSAYKQWDAFCAESNDAWLWHTTPWLLYTEVYKPDAKSESLSFFVMQDETILAICPLFLERSGSRTEFSFGGGGTPAPALAPDLNQKTREKTRKYIFAHLDALAKEKGVSKIEFRFPVLNESALSGALPEANYLPKFGFLDTSLSTQVIEVGRDIRELQKDIRHGHASDIDRARKFLTGEIITGETVTVELFDAYRKMHALAAGRVTRPARTFEIQYDLLKSGNAFLAGAKQDGEYVGFSYILMYKQGAYYASACNDPRVADLPIAHLLQWNSIEYLHSIGMRWYEIGWQRCMPSLSGIWSEKEISISKFTRGFGGFAVPLVRGEKYYDSAYFREVFEARIQKSAEVITKGISEQEYEKTT
jgi:hypothetical protein